MNHERAKDTLTSKYPEAIRCIDASEQYLRTYPELLRSTAILAKEMGEDALPAIAHMAYGWMPTILKKFSDSKPAIVGPATGCRSFEEASAADPILGGLANQQFMGRNEQGTPFHQS